MNHTGKLRRAVMEKSCVASEQEHRKDTLDTLPLPWEAEWDVETTILAASQFVRRVAIGTVSGSAWTARDVLGSLLATRYEPLRTLPLDERDGLLSESKANSVFEKACDNQSATFRALRRKLHAHVDAHARRVATALLDVDRDDASIVRIALFNYVEAIAEFVSGGREHMHAFLAKCALGAWAHAPDADEGLLW